MTTVCIDGFNLALPKGSGIATYSRGLLGALESLNIDSQVLYGPRMGRNSDHFLTQVELADALSCEMPASKMDRYWRTVLSPYGRTARPVRDSGQVVWPGRGRERPGNSPMWASRDLFYIANRSFERRGCFTPLDFAPKDRHARPDAVHWTTVLPLHARKAVNIYTIHDLIPLTLPHSTKGSKAKFFDICKTIARKADHIVTVSETIKRDIVAILDLPEDRVTNTYQAVDFPQDIASELLEVSSSVIEDAFNVGHRGYFLYYGAIEPKKNVGRLIEAYILSGSKLPLIIVAGRSWLAEDETGLLGELQRHPAAASERIRKVEYLPASMLSRLIRGARATLFPSLYEGFGLPVIESMVAGTACLTSRVGALEEVAGGAALLVDPYDVEAMAKGIRSLAEDDDLLSQLQAAGQKRAADFSPEAHAKRLETVYRNVGLLPA